MRQRTEIVLPDGSTVESLGFKTDEFHQRIGVEPRSDLTKIKGGHAKKIIAIAAEMYPDQVKLKEGL